MPRRATKSCQTDPVFLSEEQVEAIVSKRIVQEFERLKSELKSTIEFDSSESKAEEILKPQVSQLEKSLVNIQNEVQILRTSNEKVINDVDSLNNLQQVAEVSLEQMQETMESLEQKIETNLNNQPVQNKLDEVEQQSKLNNLRIFGLKEEEGEDVTKTIIDFANKDLKVKIQPNEIEAKRMGSIQPMSLKPRDILITFDSRSLRNTIFRKRKMLREHNQEVYINEDLTTRRSFLFFQARKFRKRQKLFGAWTQAGNILIKTSQDSPPKEVHNIDEIKSLILENNSSDADTNSDMSEMTNYEDFP